MEYEKHIAQYIQEALIAKGFKVQANGEYHGWGEFPELAGMLGAGRRVVRLKFSENLRWIDMLDGWGKSDKCLDLRPWYLAPDYEAAALEILADHFGVR